MTKTCICDACGRVSTMTLADERSHCCGSTMRVREYVDRLELGDATRKISDIEVKDGNNVYLVRLVNGVPHILIRIDQNDDYACGDGLLSPTEKERIIDLALGQKRVRETRRSTTGTQRRAAHGIGGGKGVPASNGILRHKLEQFLSAAKRIIQVFLGRERGGKLSCSAIPTVADLKVRTGETPKERGQRDMGGQQRAIQGGGESGETAERKYEGFSNWATWHVARLIDSTENTHNSKRRLALNALKKGIGIDQLTDQFRRLFKKQEEETRKFYEDNAAAARAERGAYERQQLEGKEPLSSGNKIKDIEWLVGQWYDKGGYSGWEDPMGEVNWREIAWNAAENMEMEIRAQGYELKKKAPEYTEYDKGMLKSFGISSAPHQRADGGASAYPET